MKLRKVIDRTLVLYLVIGVLNFILCTAIMFVLFNICNYSEHLAPLVNYGLGSLIWYLACRYVLFPDQKTTVQQLVRFAVEVIVCYGIAYYAIARPCAELMLRSEKLLRLFSFGGAEKIQGNCEMSIGAIAYAIINYFGQRYFVFNKHLEHHRKQRESKPQDKE